jgi:hypothetical protein
MLLPLEATKLFDILGRRDERIIDTLCVFTTKKTDPVFPASEDEAAVSFSTMGVFHGGFASSSSQLFASVS